ncbi:MAG: SDR family NAD(P)-dependent oxidoreductase [Magnetococcales bacterium]|nr:SDR family NAD(P)-dependent oxidoreductase [Magnetococcales bacterium]
MTQKSVGHRLWGGIRLAVGVFVGLPFIVVLLPLWYLHCWHERRVGRPAPEAPWAEIWPRANPVEAPMPRLAAADAHSGVPDHARLEARCAACGASPRTPPGALPLDPTRGMIPLDPQNDISSPVALVTGGAHHLGATICRDLATLGYRVAVVYHRSATQAAAVVADIRAQGGQAQAFPVDQSDPVQISRLLDAVEQVWGIPDLLINNASLFVPTPMAEATWEGLEQLCRVNLQGPLWLAICVGERMKNRAQATGRGGQIIQMCDIWGERPLAGHTAYSVTKAGLIMATRSLARELAPSVRVNGIAPGAVLPKEGEVNFQTMLARTPLAQQAGPDAVLHAIRYLLTARFVTGEMVHVDGGRGLV